MRKLTAILLLSLYITSATELHQLFKIPVLVGHFVKHRQQDPALSVWQFLCMHYAQGDVHDADYDEDMKLPFKSHDNCANASTFISVLPGGTSLPVRSEKIFYGAPRSFPEYDEHFRSAACLNAVWQPPKSA